MALSTQFSTGQGSGENGRLVGREAASEALDDLPVERVDYCQIFTSSKYDYENVLDGVRDIVGDEATLFGASAAGEFTEAGVEAGSVTVSLVASDTLKFFTSLSTGLTEDPHEAIFEAVNDLPRLDDPRLEEYPHRAAINLHDGLSGIGNTVSRLSLKYFDGDVKLAGGAAGDDLQLEETVVFADGEIASDAVGYTLIASKNPIPMTVNHGHEPISEPMTVTEAEGSTVYKLNDEPAYQVWKEAIRESAQETYGIDVDTLQDGSDELSMMLTRYEFGIESEPDQEADDKGIVSRLREYIEEKMISTSGYNIRWPGLTETTGGALEFAVEVHEGTELRVMHSSPEDQINCVREAASDAVARSDGEEIAGGFVYDCICRGTILGNDFDKAVTAISDEVQSPFAGFETYGEICSDVEEYTSYHNTSSVVMLLPE
ncbi:FIST signal transduction protein [Halorhabdus rudnickae]|uniref:FIST signal transduction protein n=1 Tax=Halorhabdus rudnickae TaxID=1775544 RepID=UPI00108237AE|nr:FIST N-terminal domain-containing protein [Halorhabdus rudnickae]